MSHFIVLIRKTYRNDFPVFENGEKYMLEMFCRLFDFLMCMYRISTILDYFCAMCPLNPIFFSFSVINFRLAILIYTQRTSTNGNLTIFIVAVKASFFMLKASLIYFSFVGTKSPSTSPVNYTQRRCTSVYASCLRDMQIYRFDSKKTLDHSV